MALFAGIVLGIALGVFIYGCLVPNRWRERFGQWYDRYL